MSVHSLTIDFGTSQDTATLSFRCTAPAGALCHAFYECSCEEWTDEGIVHGKPFHVDMDDVTHFGYWRTEECRLEDWFDGSDEVVRGAVTVPVQPTWDGGYYGFDITPGAKS